MRHAKFGLIAIGIILISVIIFFMSRSSGVSVKRNEMAIETIAGIATQSCVISDQIDSLSFTPEGESIFLLTKSHENQDRHILRCSAKDIGAM